MCSDHFVGRKKSDDQNSPSYIPSIFTPAESSNDELPLPAPTAYPTGVYIKGKNMGIISISFPVYLILNINPLTTAGKWLTSASVMCPDPYLCQQESKG